MINFNPLDIDNEDVLNKIISAKHGRNKKTCDKCEKDGARKIPEDCKSCENIDRKQLLDDIKSYIFSRYKTFSDNTECIDSILEENHIGMREKKILEDSFKNSNDMKMIKKQIKDNLPNAIKGKCPYCMISAHNTFDHYFDKSTFPEFTLFTKNLLPCCAACNSYKGNKVRNKDNEREIINFYYDMLPDYQFIFFDMEIDFETIMSIPFFNIRLDLNDSLPIEPIIQNHFDNLRLMQRYREQIPDKVSTILGEAKRSYKDGINVDCIISEIRRRIDSLREYNGTNYWEACLYEGLIKEKNVFEQLLNTAFSL